MATIYCRSNEGIYVWNARGDQGYLSDGTESGLDEPTRKTQLTSISHEKRFINEPHCSQLVCNPKTISYQIKEFDESTITHGFICRGKSYSFQFSKL